MKKGQHKLTDEPTNSPLGALIVSLLTKMYFDRNDSDEGDNSEKKKMQSQLQGV